MKLYTDEHVRKAIYKARALSDWWDIEYQFQTNDIIDSLTPIELPSDEGIEEGNKKYIEDVNTIVHRDLERDGYLEMGFWAGAKWVISHIKQQDKNNL